MPINIKMKDWDTATSLCARSRNDTICRTASEIVRHATTGYLKCEWGTDTLVMSGETIIKKQGSNSCHVGVDSKPGSYRIVP